MTTVDTTPTDLDEATFQRLIEVSRALDDTERTIQTMQGVLEVGRRELARQAERLRELSPGILEKRG